jgi:hypothetical protein
MEPDLFRIPLPDLGFCVKGGHLKPQELGAVVAQGHGCGADFRAPSLDTTDIIKTIAAGKSRRFPLPSPILDFAVRQ